MQNYFNYFTEIEERFQQRRGSLLMLSTLDWALIEIWREAGLPLEVVLRGIDDAFDKHDAKARTSGKRSSRKVNGLAWAAQSVMRAAEEAVDAATGARIEPVERESGFEGQRVAAYLDQNAAVIEAAKVEAGVAARLRELAAAMRGETPEAAPLPLEALDRILTALEERMLAGVLTSAPEEEIIRLKEQAARELAPYKGKMGAVQIRQVEQQFLQKRLLAERNLPRLSLFYMSHG